MLYWALNNGTNTNKLTVIDLTPLLINAGSERQTPTDAYAIISATKIIMANVNHGNPDSRCLMPQEGL